MIQLTQTTLLSGPGDIPRLRQEFAETGCAVLPGFLSPPIVESLLRCLESTRFEERHEEEVIGTTLFVPPTDPVFFLLQFILNRPALYRFSEQVSGCSRIANFIGRLHRTTVAANQYVDWHQDLAHARTLGLCINLSAEPYTGGVLQIRNPEKQIKAAVGRSNPGDGCFFRIDKGWQHRLTPVESGRRTVGVGWFRTAPEWSSYAPSVSRMQMRQMPPANGM